MSYGNQLCLLFQLNEMKSSDKKMSLLHFIVKTIKEKFPSLANFDVDFDYAEKAATGNRGNSHVWRCLLRILCLFNLREEKSCGNGDE